jgi:hypothetical protein
MQRKIYHSKVFYIFDRYRGRKNNSCTSQDIYIKISVSDQNPLDILIILYPPS